MYKNTIYIDSIKYHEIPSSGKIHVNTIKSVINNKDLTLAYSPGVAIPCIEISKNINNIFKYTSKKNLVGVISNGTAVLGLGNIGPYASKPVMEGKSLLFKKFANIDSFDIEINEKDPEKLCKIIKSLEPTFGAINLEDIKAPECFYIERKLRKNMNIPVFHDDQHGTAIVVAAAIINWLKLVNKNIKDIKLVCCGAGAAAIACLDLITKLGLNKSNIYVLDLKGVIYEGRQDIINEDKQRYVQRTNKRTLEDIIEDSDIFLGLSAGGILKEYMLKKMNKNPLVLALANPYPEILPEIAKKVRSDLTIATGRSDYDNQVNNALCFPYIFRGALDSNAKCINEEMKLAAVYAIANLVDSKNNNMLNRNYLIPKLIDPRLIVNVSSAVAEAAYLSGASNSFLNIDNYKKILKKYSNFDQKISPLYYIVSKNNKNNKKNILFIDGENKKILNSIYKIIKKNIIYPIILGRKNKILKNISKLNLNFDLNDIKIIDIKKKLCKKRLYKNILNFFNIKNTINIDGIICGLYNENNNILDDIKYYFKSKINITLYTIILKNHINSFLISLKYKSLINNEDKINNFIDMIIRKTFYINIKPNIIFLINDYNIKNIKNIKNIIYNLKTKYKDIKYKIMDYKINNFNDILNNFKSMKQINKYLDIIILDESIINIILNFINKYKNVNIIGPSIIENNRPIYLINNFINNYENILNTIIMCINDINLNYKLIN